MLSLIFLAIIRGSLGLFFFLLLLILTRVEQKTSKTKQLLTTRNQWCKLDYKWHMPFGLNVEKIIQRVRDGIEMKSVCPVERQQLLLVVPSTSMDPVWPYIPIFMVRVEIHIFTRNLQIYKWIDQTKHVGRICRLPYFASLQRYNFISPPFHGSMHCAFDSSLSPLIGFTRVGREDREEPWSPSSGYKVPKQLTEHAVYLLETH